ncbi:nitroreductase family protein [Candidatus Sumerlaeota bacterium]|nr:nitroreductase family protein [Candidatus Sumerlaeota bacterium]
MDVMKAITIRRSVRKYKPEPIPANELRELLEAMRSAPSAANRQPWKFLVVTDQALREKIVGICRGQHFIAEAPVLIVGCGREADAWHGVGGNKKQSSLMTDISIAIDHLTLAATEKGIGTCWIQAFNEDCIKKILKIPEDVRVIALCTVGYPAEDNAFRPFEPEKRKPLDEIVCYNVYE